MQNLLKIETYYTTFSCYNPTKGNYKQAYNTTTSFVSQQSDRNCLKNEHYTVKTTRKRKGEGGQLNFKKSKLELAPNS